MSSSLSKRILISYSAISLPFAGMLMPVAVYLPPFYSEEMGIQLATVGLIFTIARISDVITDPIMGIVIDKFDTQWGRRKHWIAISIPILMLAIWMVFIPDPESVTPFYLGFWLIVLYLGYTMLSIAHQSWGAELAPDYDDRSRLFTWREVFVLTGMVTVLATPALVEILGLGDQATKVASMGLLCFVLFPLTAWPLLRNVPDRAGIQPVRVNWQEAFAILVRNTLLWRILCADFATGFATSATGALYIFMVSYSFQLPTLASIALLFIFLISTLAMPLWLKLAVSLGKDITIRIALGMGVIVHGLLFLLAETGNATGLWVYTIVYGVVFGCAPTLIRSMMADVTDYDELQTGSKRAGLFFALMTTSSKLGSAVAVGAAFTFVEVMYGFQPRIENTQQAVDGLLFTYCSFAMVAFSIAFVAFLKYPLSREKHREIEQQLQAISSQ